MIQQSGITTRSGTSALCFSFAFPLRFICSMLYETQPLDPMLFTSDALTDRRATWPFRVPDRGSVNPSPSGDGCVFVLWPTSRRSF